MMNVRRVALSSGAAIAAMGALDVAAAHETSPSTGATRTVQAAVETRDLGDDRGELNLLTADFEIEDENTTVIFSPVVGELRGRFESETAAGIGVTLYQRFDAGFSTRTHLALAEDEPVFPHFDLAQDITFGIAPQTTATLGARWAEYVEGREVYFVSAGLRYYFERGSVAYRLSYVDPENRDPHIAHLVNLSLTDVRGEGKTQLWLGAGASSFETQLADDVSGENYALLLRRVQPLTEDLNLTGSVGVAAYDRPTGRVTGASFGLGLELDLD